MNSDACRQNPETTSVGLVSRRNESEVKNSGTQEPAKPEKASEKWAN